MVNNKIVFITLLSIAEIIVIIFIYKKNKVGYYIALSIVGYIVGIATILAIPELGPVPVTDSPDGHVNTVEEGEGEETFGKDPAVTENNEEKEPSGDDPITEEPKYEIEYEGTVIDYDSFTDFFGHERNDVIYMEYDGTPSSIIIHTNGECSNISFDFYAVAEMDPEDMTQLTYIADEDSHSVHEYAAIPKYNSYGSFDEDITGRREIKITFHSAGIPSTEHPCAVLIDNLSIQ